MKKKLLTSNDLENPEKTLYIMGFSIDASCSFFYTPDDLPPSRVFCAVVTDLITTGFVDIVAAKKLIGDKWEITTCPDERKFILDSKPVVTPNRF